MENEKETGSTKDSKTHPEATSNGGDPHTKSKKRDLSRSSSSSSSSSSASSNPLDRDEKNAPDQPEWSMVSASPRSGTGPLSSSEILPNTPDWNASPRTSPPLQTMDRPTSYDPNRIPSSVFNNRNTSPMDWSVASNESLFSIHMGNNSFNRDHALLGKSGELTRPEEWNNSPSGDFNNLLTLPTVIETHNERASMKDSEEEENETPKIGSKKFGGDDNKEKTPKVEVPHVLASPPRLSDDSGNSSKSFAFPVLAGGDGSVKPVPETPHRPAQPHPQPKPEPEPEPEPKPEPKPESKPEPSPQAAGATPAPQNKWFSCFSCCPLCC